MGRTSDARQRILDAACLRIGARGYTAIGVAEICSSAGVPKGSFYYFFASKQALTVAVIDEHWASQREEWVTALTAPKPPLDRLANLFAATAAQQAAALRTTGAVTGCLFANLALELSGTDEAVRRRLAEIFDEQVALVAAVIDIAVTAGDVPAWAATPSTARAIIAQLEGLVMFAKLSNDVAPLSEVWRHSLLLLGASAAAATAATPR